MRPLALALAKTDIWEGHAGQTQANPFGFGIHLDSITCLHVTVLSGIPGICRADCYMHAVRQSRLFELRIRTLAIAIASLSPEHPSTYQIFATARRQRRRLLLSCSTLF